MIDIYERYGAVIPRSELKNIIKSYIGINYLDKGRSEEHGYDCIAPMIETAKRFGVEVNESMNYSNFPTGYQLIEKLEKYLDRIERKDIKVGDILVMNNETKLPSHLAFVYQVQPNIRIVHATNNSLGKVVEHRLIPNLEHLIYGWYRYKNILEDE